MLWGKDTKRKTVPWQEFEIYSKSMNTKIFVLKPILFEGSNDLN